MALVACSECSAEISDKAPHCPRCGCPQSGDERVCPDCATPIPPRARFCPACRHVFGPAAKTRRGSAGNVLAAIVSLFLPGLGQLFQGRVLAAVGWFLGAILLWLFSYGLLGWIAHLGAAFHAAVWKGPRV
jgi:TM2 domain-containing membrane protein YozV